MIKKLMVNNKMLPKQLLPGIFNSKIVDSSIVPFTHSSDNWQMQIIMTRIDTKHIYLTTFLLLGCSGLAFAQSASLKSELLKITSVSDNLTRKSPSEKLYLQFDKPYYAVGDTLWFKAYLFNAAYLTASDKSGLMYIDIANDSNKVIKQYKLPVHAGLSWGNISLDEKEFTTGTYTLRAYTNWMRNFGDDYFYYKTFYISSANENNLLINQQVSTSVVNGSNTADVKLQFSDINKKPIRIEPLNLQVISEGKRLYKQKLPTDISGIVDVNFAIPQKASNITIVAESEKKDRKAVIPVALNRYENVDTQFLPESGNLVAGLPAHIGFKAIGEDGKGIDISGIITDHAQQQVAAFKSLHNGMGSFDLTAKDGEVYTAKVTLPNGAIKEYPLPVVKITGTVLQVKNTMESDSLGISVATTNDIVQSNESYFLIGKARGIFCYAAIVNFHESNLVKIKIAKSLFPSGLAHFTLMTEKYQPLNERLVFIDHHDNLNIHLETSKPAYGVRDSIALHIKVTDNNGKPITGSFSLAVTDDAQVKTDSLSSENIITHLLLTSDLKGYLEEPGYYLSSITKDKWQALDNLLLTQGWVGYNWQQVLNSPAITYQPEHELEVMGNVLNAFNKPVKGTNVILLSKSPALVMDTVTDNNGRFIFHHFPKVDTPQFVLKAVNKNGKSFNVGITVDEVKPPEFIKSFSPVEMPWYVNSDSILLNYAKSNALTKLQQYFPNSDHVLKEVKILSKKIIKGSQNLNGPGNADLVLDEKDLEAANKKSWLQLLEENIKGFKVGEIKKDWFFLQDIKNPITIDKGMVVSREHEWYFINDKPVKFYIDGISVTDMFPTSTSEVLNYSSAFLNMTSFLKAHKVEDIKGVELNFSDKYSLIYTSTYIPLDSKQPPINPNDASFIEITTRSGHGPQMDNTPGMFLYKPLAISYPKQFYKPKYTLNDTSKHIPDLRSTIDWEPNVITDANGEAKVSFFTADKPSTYTVIIEGSDMNGNLGYKREKIIVNDKKTNGK
jgi:hypothetical protein